MSDDSPRRFDVLLTAQEAYPALEQLFLDAKEEILAGFRIFDPDTKLRSEKAQLVGDTWFDLIADTLNRGVRISLAISDFDPVVRTTNHKYTWECVDGLRAAGDASQNPGNLTVSAAMHPARVGLLPRLVLWPRLIKEIRENLKDANVATAEGKAAFKKHTPHLQPLLTEQNGKLAPRLFPPPPLVPVTHHQKLAVFDRTLLYIGGLDLNDRRYDTPQHQRAAATTWHDTQVIVDGPVVAEAVDHLQNFQSTTEGRKQQSTRHLLRTISAKRAFALPYLSPKQVVSELSDTHHQQVDRAERLIYLESQFFRDRALAKRLAKRALEKPTLSLIILLPAAPEDVAFDDPGSDAAYGEHLQAKCIDTVRQAFGSRVFIGSPVQPRPAEPDGRATLHGAPLIYLHAKVSIFDDTCGIVSSANLNGRSFAWDTEAGITTDTMQEVAELKSRCFHHWLGDDADVACFNDETACDGWAAMAARNVQLAPSDRQGFILPYAVGPAEELARNLPGVPDEMV